MKELCFDAPLIMGIVNLTPDSFFDGGRWLQPEKALAHMRQLAADGADILDLGAASSRPGYVPLSADEELGRIRPLLELLTQDDITAFPPLSVDTDQKAVAEYCLQHSFTVVNQTGLPTAEMARLAAEYDAYLVLMFRGPFGEGDRVEQMREFFRRQTEIALNCGVREQRLIMDPGIGFNMEMEDCLTLVARMGELKCGNYPLLMGMSNKRFLGWLTGAEPGQRESANLAAELFAAENGVGILRVHDVCSSRQALTVWQRLQERKN